MFFFVTEKCKISSLTEIFFYFFATTRKVQLPPPTAEHFGTFPCKVEKMDKVNRVDKVDKGGRMDKKILNLDPYG